MGDRKIQTQKIPISKYLFYPYGLVFCGMALLGFLPACFVTSTPEEDVALVHLGLDLPNSNTYAQQGKSYWDAQGLFKIKEFPKYVRVGIETKDYELLSGTWPDPDKGIGPSGEGPNGEVFVELKVPAGNNRRINVMAYIYEQGKLLIYHQKTAQTVNLVTGQSLDLEMQVERHDTGNLKLYIQCFEGSEAVGTPSHVALVDDRAKVIFPSQALVENNQVYTVTISDVPVNRPMWAQIHIKGPSGEITYIPQNLSSSEILTPNVTEITQLKVHCN